ncbi:Rne/Rng family ribonuclease [Nesterenkonia alba]|uniref:Rne/Rng family ribonuclease n=1 Tax=Nesterenkonia alba TaxID=515814 RepID=UPI0003F59467|nr:Rne/Rng family ribonuclease [Nesterenkonia alba]
MTETNTPKTGQSTESESAAATNEPEEIFSPFQEPAITAPASTAPSSEPSSESESAPERPAVEDPVEVMFQAPDLSAVTPVPSQQSSEADDDDDEAERGSSDHNRQGQNEGGKKNRRKRRRGGRNRNKQDDARGEDNTQGPQTGEDSATGSAETTSGDSAPEAQKDKEADDDAGSGTQRSSSKASGPISGSTDDDTPVIRKKRRRRRGSADMEIEEESEDGHTVTRIRSGREAGENAPEKVTSLKGSTRLEAKRQRRRATRHSSRRGIITEAEFLARRESVDRKMIVRQRGERIQIGVLEDNVLAEHYVSHTTADSLIGNVYLGKVQNVLPSMEAAFVDIGRGRNAVLYAGEVDWDAANIGNAPRKIENALKSGDSVLVQVTKDPVGHKGARLTSQVSLPGRYLVFVPGGSMTGISRKLPDTERARLKKILKENMPENTGVIVRTAAEGASEEELTNDINRLRALWESIQSQAQDKKVLPPELLYAEPDLTIKVVRDVFNEDFSAMEIQGEETYDNVEAYVTYVAPHLLDRLKKWDPAEHEGTDIFAEHRIDEQLNKALGRKVHLPSGGSLIFDRTEAMTVVDVNTGKFTGSGGNLEETVTKNNLEAAEEIVRQLRLRDIGGIIVIDFIDMVLESNRDLVLRRMVECLGRDRTKHQVAEVTSLGLVQMTRKRMGTGLIEVFSSECEHCAGRGIITHEEPVENRPSYTADGELRSAKNSKKRRKKGKKNGDSGRDQDPKELKKLEKARQGLAQVAAATNGSAGGSADQSSADAAQQGTAEKQHSGQTSEASRSDDAGSGSSSTTRTSTGGQESGGPGGDHHHTEDKAVLTIGGETVEVPKKTGQSAEKSPAADPASALSSLDEALASRSQQPARRSPRRRRRAAGSAQGASGEVHQVEPEVSGTQARFSATASTPDTASEQKNDDATAPVMLGVGVSAEEIAKKN